MHLSEPMDKYKPIKGLIYYIEYYLRELVFLTECPPVFEDVNNFPGGIRLKIEIATLHVDEVESHITSESSMLVYLDNIRAGAFAEFIDRP